MTTELTTDLARARALATTATLLTSARWWRTQSQHWEADTLVWTCRNEVLTTRDLAEITARHARSVTNEQLTAFVDQLAAREPTRGTANDIRLETYAAEQRGCTR